jgi:hypothetical protein
VTSDGTVWRDLVLLAAGWLQGGHYGQASVGDPLPADQAAPLVPPDLLDVLKACSAAKTWATPQPPDRATCLVRDPHL